MTDSSEPTPAVIVGGIGSTISLVRSLGRAGVPVHVLAAGRPTLAGVSRYCRSVTDVGDAPGIVERWLKWLEEDCPTGAVLLPSGDEGVELMATHRERLEAAGHHMPPTSGETSLAMLDKERTYELARAAAVPCPNTWTVRDAGQIEDIQAQLSYPCALKPLHSHLFSKHFSVKLFIAHNATELTEHLTRTSALDLEMLVTEIIPGPERCTWTYSTLIDRDGQSLFELTRQKLRSQPVHFGTNCFLVTRRNADAMRAGREFVRGVGLRGIAHVEFKWDVRDGRYKLIECNHRFVNVQEVIRRAGVDVALLAYREALGARGSDHPEAWREGVHLWFPARDLKAARDYHREGQLTWRRWMRSLLNGPVYTPTFTFDDPAPTALIVWRRCRRLYKSLSRRYRGSGNPS